MIGYVCIRTHRVDSLCVLCVLWIGCEEVVREKQKREVREVMIPIDSLCPLTDFLSDSKSYFLLNSNSCDKQICASFCRADFPYRSCINLNYQFCESHEPTSLIRFPMKSRKAEKKPYAVSTTPPIFVFCFVFYFFA